GAMLGLGVLCRHLAIVFGGALVVAQLRERGWRGFFRSVSIFSLVLPFAFAGAYMFWQWRAWGDPFAFWKARSTWGGTAWWGVTDLWRIRIGYPHAAVLAIFALVPTAGAVALVRRRHTAELAAAAVPLMIVVWAIGAFGLGRYSASCWPAFL